MEAAHDPASAPSPELDQVEAARAAPDADEDDEAPTSAPTLPGVEPVAGTHDHETAAMHDEAAALRADAARVQPASSSVLKLVPEPPSDPGIRTNMPRVERRAAAVEKPVVDSAVHRAEGAEPALPAVVRRSPDSAVTAPGPAATSRMESTFPTMLDGARHRRRVVWFVVVVITVGLGVLFAISALSQVLPR